MQGLLQIYSVSVLPLYPDGGYFFFRCNPRQRTYPCLLYEAYNRIAEDIYLGALAAACIKPEITPFTKALLFYCFCSTLILRGNYENSSFTNTDR